MGESGKIQSGCCCPAPSSWMQREPDPGQVRESKAICGNRIRHRRDKHARREFLPSVNDDAEVARLPVEPRGVHRDGRGGNAARDEDVGHIAGGQRSAARRHVVKLEREIVVSVRERLAIGSGERPLKTDAVGAAWLGDDWTAAEEQHEN